MALAYVRNKPSQPWHRAHRGGDSVSIVALCGHPAPPNKTWFYVREAINPEERVCQTCAAKGTQ